MTTSATPRVEVKIIDQRLTTWGLPSYQSAMAAAIDLYACIDAPLVLEAGSAAQLISAGIAIHMANPYMVALIAPRSGSGHKKGLVLGNSVGVIDADYSGTIFISAWNRNTTGTPPIVIEPGERIAQMMFVPILRPVFNTVETFTVDSERGAGGFGSTGTV